MQPRPQLAEYMLTTEHQLCIFMVWHCFGELRSVRDDRLKQILRLEAPHTNSTLLQLRI
jgi:hypothetical protein